MGSGCKSVHKDKCSCCEWGRTGCRMPNKHDTNKQERGYCECEHVKKQCEAEGLRYFIPTRSIDEVVILTDKAYTKGVFVTPQYVHMINYSILKVLKDAFGIANCIDADTLMRAMPKNGKWMKDMIADCMVEISTVKPKVKCLEASCIQKGEVLNKETQVIRPITVACDGTVKKLLVNATLVYVYTSDDMLPGDKNDYCLNSVLVHDDGIALYPKASNETLGYACGECVVCAGCAGCSACAACEEVNVGAGAAVAVGLNAISSVSSSAKAFGMMGVYTNSDTRSEQNDTTFNRCFDGDQ